MTKFNPYKPAIISSILNILIAVILVKLFRSDYTQDSFFYDVCMFLLIVFGIQVLFGIKNIFVGFIVNKIMGHDVSNVYFEHMKQFNFPVPNDIFHIDDPEDYLHDVIDDSSLEPETRIYAAGLQTEVNVCRNTGKFFTMFMALRILKQAIKKYARYCSLNSKS